MVRLRVYCFNCRKLKSGQDIAGDDKHFQGQQRFQVAAIPRCTYGAPEGRCSRWKFVTLFERCAWFLAFLKRFIIKEGDSMSCRSWSFYSISSKVWNECQLSDVLNFESYGSSAWLSSYVLWAKINRGLMACAVTSIWQVGSEWNTLSKQIAQFGLYIRENELSGFPSQTVKLGWHNANRPVNSRTISAITPIYHYTLHRR